MKQEQKRCIDRELYRSALPGAPFEEARAILLGKYSENELNQQHENRIREHLQRCDCCNLFLKDLEIPEITSSVYVEANCPSSAALDAFLFHRASLPETEAKRIERHMEECELCRGETAWLKDLESKKVTEFAKPSRDWVKTLAIAAALVFAVLSTLLFVQSTKIQSTEAQLRAIARVQEPGEINYAALRSSSVDLPDEVEDIYDQGVNSLKQGRYEDALRAMQRVTESVPEHSGAVYLLGYSYYQMREMEKAFEYCDRAEKIRPHNIERCLSLVNIALMTGHYGRAIREISGLNHEVPDHPQVKALYNQITSITRGKTIQL